MSHSLLVNCDNNLRSNWLDKGSEMNLSINHSTFDTLTASPCTPGSPLTPMNLSINQSMSPTPINQSLPLSPNPSSLQPSQSNSPRRRASQQSTNQSSNQSNAQSPHARVASLDSATSHLHRRPRSSILIWPSLANSVVLPSLSQLASLSFNSFDWTEDQLLQSTLNVLNDLNLINQLMIDLPALQCFLVAIKHKYRQHPYHNFYHGFSVFQFGYYMIKSSRLIDVLSPMDQLACLISCYCHDVDHPGTTNCLHPDTKVLRVKQAIQSIIPLNNQSIHQSDDQSINQSVNQSVSQSDDEVFEVEAVRAGDLLPTDRLIDEFGRPCLIDCLDKETVTDRLFSINQSRGLSYTVSANHRLTLEATGPRWSDLSFNQSFSQPINQSVGQIQWTYWVSVDDRLYERGMKVSQNQSSISIESRAGIFMMSSMDPTVNQSVDPLMLNSIDSFSKIVNLLKLVEKPLMKGDRFDLIVDTAYDILNQLIGHNNQPISQFVIQSKPHQTLPFTVAAVYPPQSSSQSISPSINVDQCISALSHYLNIDSQSINQPINQSINHSSFLLQPSQVSHQQWLYKPTLSQSVNQSINLLIDFDLPLNELSDLVDDVNQSINQSVNQSTSQVRTPFSLQALQDIWGDLTGLSDFAISLHLYQSINQSVTQSDNQLVNQSINQSASHQVGHSLISDFPVVLAAGPAARQRITQSINQSINQSVSQCQTFMIADVEIMSINQSVNHSATQSCKTQYVVFAPSPQSINQFQQLFLAHHVAIQLSNSQSIETIKQSINESIHHSFNQSVIQSIIPERLLGPVPKPPTSHILSITQTIHPSSNQSVEPAFRPFTYQLVKQSSSESIDQSVNQSINHYYVVALKAVNPSNRFLLSDGSVTHNSFQVAVDSALARIHNNIAVLENHHAFVTCELLRDKRCNFLINQSVNQSRKFKKTLVASILSTDMAIHVDLCHSFPTLGENLSVFDESINQSINQSMNSKRESLNQLALNLVTHSSDLSAQCMDWLIARQWEEKVTCEFMQQSVLESELGLPLSAWMVGLEGGTTRFKAHVEFLQYVMDPLWTVVSHCLPSMKPAYENLMKNRILYIALRDEATDEKPLSINQSMNQSLSSSSDRTINQSINQSIHLTLNDSQPLMETDLLPPSSTSVSQLNSPERSTNKCTVIQSINHSMSQSINESMNQSNDTSPSNESNNQSNNQSINQSIDEEDQNLAVDSYLVYYVALARP